MSEDDAAASTGASPEAPAITAREAASYIFELSGEMAAMAEACALSRVAAALELARSLCAEELAVLAAGHSGSGKAAPEEAA
jgi:hypothetical protein